MDNRLWSIVFAVLCTGMLGCENSDKAIQEWTESRNTAEQARDITTLFSQSGRMKAKLTSPLMLRYQADTVYVEFPKTLHVDFYDSTGVKESSLDAMYGKYFETANKVFLRDSVVVANVKGDTLRCPELWWNQATGKFYTDKRVRIRRTDGYIYGGLGLEAEQDLSNVTIFDPSGVIAAPTGF